MYIAFPDGDERSVEWDEWPEQCFLLCDATFPYADGMSSCPATLYSPHGAAPQVMEELDAEIERIVSRKLKDGDSDEWPSSIPDELKTLVLEIVGGAEFIEEELVRDSYIDLAAYKDYLSEVVTRSPTFMTETIGEDEGGVPGGTSAYRLYWDASPSGALKFFDKQIEIDTGLLKSV